MILVALGANLPTPEGTAPAATLRRAAAEIAALPALQPIALSRLWDSAAVPPSAQPRFVNAVMALEGSVDPDALLAALHGIEARYGRVRGEVNAARTLDLDLIDANGAIRAGPLILPHPRLGERAFVLLPLADVAPAWRHPVTGKGVAELVAGLDPAVRAACRPLDEAPPP